MRLALARHTRWEIRLCGRVAVSTQDGLAGSALPGRQGQLLLAYLVCHRTRACPRYELEDVLWPERAPAASDSALSSLLSKLRRALGPDALTGRAELRLALPEPLWVDTEALADAVEVAVQALDDRRWADAAAQARAALAVATEPFLAECDGPWVLERRREVEGLRLRALEALGEAGLRLGGRELDAAEHAARTAIGLAPFRESAHRLLMEIHEAGGNAAEALRSFDELRRLLRDELGTAPGPQVMALHERLLRGDAPAGGGAGHASRSRPRRCPRRSPPRPRRAPFVGRADDLAALQEAWDAALGDDRRLVLLAGEPGIGKSRLAAEFTRAAHADGAVVLYGRFDETGPGAYQPVLEMLRGWSGGAALTGPRSGSARARPTSPRCCRSSACPARRRPCRRRASTRPGRSASACSTRSPRCSPSSPPALRCCSSSTTCTGPTARPCSSCATSCARRSRGARCSSAPTATPSSRRATRCRS